MGGSDGCGDGRAAAEASSTDKSGLKAATFASRATVATVNGSSSTATVLWDDMAPRPLPVSGDYNKGTCACRRLKRPFLVAPLLGNTSNSGHDSNDDQEEELPITSLEALLPFECDDQQSPPSHTPATLKEQGDALLRLKDYSAAVAQYEAALGLTSSLELGGTMIIDDGTGRTVLAEVDCIDEEEEGSTKCTADVTIVGSGDEKTVDASKDILLCLLDNDAGERLQERILLNLSRCLLQLADIDGSANVVRATKYRKAAVLGCTLALTCTSYAGESGGDGDIGTESKARLIRAGAYLDLGKSKHATADAKRVLKADAGNAQAKKLLRNIERREILRKRTDKKLAKDVCKWVNTATNAATSGNGTPVSGDGDGGTGGEEKPRCISSEPNSFFYNNVLFQIVFAVIISIVVKLWLQAYEMLKQ